MPHDLMQHRVLHIRHVRMVRDDNHHLARRRVRPTLGPTTARTRQFRNLLVRAHNPDRRMQPFRQLLRTRTHRFTPRCRITCLHTWILETFNYLCGRIQIQVVHLSEIDSLLVYKGLDFFFVRIQQLALIYPVEPFGGILREQTANIIHLNAPSTLIQV